MPRPTLPPVPGAACPRRALLRLGIATVTGVAVPVIAIGGANAFRDRDCADFDTWRQAQRFFKRHDPRDDPHGLDRDGDGIACEELR